MVPGAITRNTADPRMAAGRFTLTKITPGRQSRSNPKHFLFFLAAVPRGLQSASA